MFKQLIKSSKFEYTQRESISISIYPISEYNLEGIKLLIYNCDRVCGNQDNINVKIATVNTQLWLGDFLNKYWKNISYVSAKTDFNILKLDNDNIISKYYKLDQLNMTDDEMYIFFKERIWKKLVLYSVVKYVDLADLSVYYNIRYADITEKYEERDDKINNILGDYEDDLPF